MRTTPALNALTIAGLTEREASVWQALSSGKAMNVSQIARATELHRPAVYVVLPSLVEKKLVKETKGKRRVSYRSTGTRALEAWRASRDADFAAQLKKLGRHEVQEDVSEDVRVYRGKELRKVWEDVLASSSKSSIFFRYDGYGPSVSPKKYFPDGYYEKIERKCVDRFVITNAVLRRSGYKKKLECASKMLPGSFDDFEQGVCQFVYGDKVALIDFMTETAFVITNAVLAKYHMRLFQYLYHTLPE